MSVKNISRLRRAKKTRMNIRHQETPRLTVYRSSQHFYAQVFDSLGSKVIASAFRPPEPYKGKGVKYADETIRRKEAKKAAGGA